MYHIILVNDISVDQLSFLQTKANCAVNCKYRVLLKCYVLMKFLSFDILISEREE